jgi:hypothetical protein
LGEPKEAVSENQIWKIAIGILLDQTQSSLANITRWDGGFLILLAPPEQKQR